MPASTTVPITLDDEEIGTVWLERPADLLHLHHSSVARRLGQIAAALRIEPTAPAGLARAGLARTTWRLLND